MKHLDKYARYCMALKHARMANSFIPSTSTDEEWIEYAVDLVWGWDEEVDYFEFVRRCKLSEEEE